jgi:hypothetical protein
LSISFSGGCVTLPYLSISWPVFPGTALCAPVIQRVD